MAAPRSNTAGFRLVIFQNALYVGIRSDNGRQVGTSQKPGDLINPGLSEFL